MNQVSKTKSLYANLSKYGLENPKDIEGVFTALKSFNEEALFESFNPFPHEEDNLAQAVIKQCAKYKNLDDKERFYIPHAFSEFYYTYENGRNSGTDGFYTFAENTDFFNKHKDTILAWFKDYVEDVINDTDCKNAADVIYAITNYRNGGVDVFWDLIDCREDEISETKNFITLQLMYEVATDLMEKSLEDYENDGIFNADEFLALCEKYDEDKNTTKTRRKQ